MVVKNGKPTNKIINNDGHIYKKEKRNNTNVIFT